MSRLDWVDLHSATDMQCAFSLFHSKLIDAHHICFPEKSFTATYHIMKPWLTSCLRDSIRKKCILNQSKSNVFELRKCMKTIAINYGNWWELPKRNITQIKYWKTNKIKKNSGQLSKALSIEIRTKLREKNNKSDDGSYTADMKIICENFNDFFLLLWGHPYPKRYLSKTAARINTSKRKHFFLYILNLLQKLK